MPKTMSTAAVKGWESQNCFYKTIKQKWLRERKKNKTEIIMFGETERAKSHLKKS